MPRSNDPKVGDADLEIEEIRKGTMPSGCPNLWRRGRWSEDGAWSLLTDLGVFHQDSAVFVPLINRLNG